MNLMPCICILHQKSAFPSVFQQVLIEISWEYSLPESPTSAPQYAEPLARDSHFPAISPLPFEFLVPDMAKVPQQVSESTMCLPPKTYYAVLSKDPLPAASKPLRQNLPVLYIPKRGTPGYFHQDDQRKILCCILDDWPAIRGADSMAFLPKKEPDSPALNVTI